MSRNRHDPGSSAPGGPISSASSDTVGQPGENDLADTLATKDQTACQWLRTGDEAFEAMLRAIEGARWSIRLEMYIFSSGPLGERFREALVRAQRRGARVRVLVDAFGSMALDDAFWEPLRSIGGEVRSFNPVALMRFQFRNHRKVLVCDERIAFVGGFNIAPEYEGDGIHRGWHDLGLKLEGPIDSILSSSFDEMYDRAEFRHKRFVIPRPIVARRRAESPAEQVLLSEPGRVPNPIQLALRRDLKHARRVRIIVAYFLPSLRLRRDLARVVRKGGRVQLILAGKSDVRLSQLAAQSLYRRLMKSGVEIYEYQPQILHAKLILVDDTVYAGSSNLDHRSLRINYEMMIRFQRSTVAEEAGNFFKSDLSHCRRIEMGEWQKSRTFWNRLKRRAAYWFLVQIDPRLARRQWQGLPD
jgi:cardiolipin synthase